MSKKGEIPSESDQSDYDEHCEMSLVIILLALFKYICMLTFLYV